MKKGADDWVALTTTAVGLFKEGRYREALPKLNSALAMQMKGDDVNGLPLLIWMCCCYERLGQVR